MTHSVHAQAVPDSLLQKLNHAVNDSVKARTILDLGEAIEASAPEKSFGYYQQALTLSSKLKNNTLILSSLNDIGVCYIELNKLDSAILIFQQAVPVAWQMNDTLKAARITANIGNVYLHKNDRVKAIEFYIQSITLWETCADKTRLPALYSNISWLFTQQKEYDKAIEYGEKALKLAAGIQDNYSEVNAMLNMSETYGETGHPEKQIELLQKALPLSEKGGDIEQIATVYDDLGDYYFKQKNYPASLENYKEGHIYVLQLGNKFHLCTSYSMIAQAYHQLNKNDSALHYILLAEQVALEVGARADLKEIYRTRAEIEQQAGHFQLASEYYSKTITLSDSLFKAATSEKVAEVEARFQTAKKQKEIIQLEKDKEIQSLSLKQRSTLKRSNRTV